MSKTIITIHFPIFIIIIISLFTFYLSFIFCAITLINSILKKKYHFSLVSIHLQFLFSHLFKVLLIYDDMMIIENIKQPLSHFQQKSDWRTTETILLNKKVFVI